MTGFSKISLFLVASFLILVWVFIGWPQIWQNPPFPPKTQEALAAIGFTGSSGLARFTSSNPTQAYSVVSTTDTIILAVIGTRGGADVTAVSSDLDGSFAQAVQSATTPNVEVWWLAPASTGSHTITFTTVATDGMTEVIELSGVDETALGNTVSNSGSDGSPTATINIGTANSWAITMEYDQWNNAPSITGGMTQINTLQQGGGTKSNAMTTREGPLSTGNDVQSFTIAKSAAWAVASAEVKVAASGNSAPTVSSVNISPSPITLTENGTSTVTVTATITDTDGCDEVFTSGTTTATLYRSGVGASCSVDANNCYVNIPLTDIGGTCTGGADTTGDASGTVEVWYIAEATDASSTFSVQNWETTVKAIDSSDASSTSTGTAELSTLLAINVTGSINYGTVNPTATSTTQTVTITNTGNFNSTDANFSGVNLEFGANSIIVTSQRYSTTTSEFWDYMDYTLDGTPTLRELNIVKSTATGTPSTQNNYWAIQTPNGTAAGTYNGTTTIEAQ